MKNIVKLLALMLVVLMTIGLLVACNDDKTPSGDQSNTGNTDDTGKDNPDDKNDPEPNAKEFSVQFTFVDPEGNTLADPIVRPKVKRGNQAYPPNGYVNDVQRFDNYVITGWDSDGDGTADEGYKNVTRNMEVKALLREKVDCTVNFTRLNGDAIANGTFVVKEGAEITDEMIAEKFDIPVEMGKYFKNWVLASETSNSDIGCIRDDCTFKPTYGDTQGVVPLVDKGAVTVDGARDAAYDNAAFLPLNPHKQADTEAEALDDDPNHFGSTTSGERYKTKTTAKAYMVWDGDFVYFLIEVSDKTVSGRNEFYVKAIENAYLNDAVELFYTFEQTQASSRNNTKVGMDAAGLAKYSVSRTRGIGGGRSTHYAEIQAEAQCALMYSEDVAIANGLYRSGYSDAAKTVEAPSYRVEIAIPAKTEGVADKAGAEADGLTIDEATGFTGGTAEDYTNDFAYQEALKDEKNYMFTEGTKLKAGAFFRVALQINDLMVDQTTLSDLNSGCHEDNTKDPVNDPALKGDRYAALSYLFNAAGVGVYPKFAAIAQTQYVTKYYVCFSLGADSNSLTTVYSFGPNREFLDKDGNDITPDED